MDFLILLLLPLPVALDLATDPANDVWQSRVERRSLECVRMSQTAAHERFPGRVPEASARMNESDADALACTRTIMVEGERPARDEAILSRLRQSVAEIAEAASATVPADRVWQVESFYPQPAVAAKIAVAARTHLVERGKAVSDRVPLLAAGDVVVIGHMPPREAFPVACARYYAEKSLGSGDAFLGIMLVDPRETQLHAGLCLDGQWRWLR